MAHRLVGQLEQQDDAEDAGFLERSVRIGETARALIDGQLRSSPGPLDRARLLAVERRHGALADLLAS